MPQKKEHGGYSDTPLLAELYDLVPGYVNRADLDFYIEYARRAGGRVLELGCGTGRVLIPLAREGIKITGIDASEFMLARCQAKLAKEPPEIRQNVKIISGDMRSFESDKSFALVITPFRAFQHLITPADQIACVSRIHKHLRPGGRFILDIYNPDLRRIALLPQPQETEDVPEFELPDGRLMRRTNRVTKINRAGQYMDVEIIYYVTPRVGKTERLVHAFEMRYLFRYEVEHLLARCGLRVVELFGNYDKSRFTDNSPEMIFVAEKPAE